jgi:hypothetical protein
VLAQMKIETGIDLHQLLDAAELLEHLVGTPFRRGSTAPCSPSRAHRRR